MALLKDIIDILDSRSKLEMKDLDERFVYIYWLLDELEKRKDGLYPTTPLGIIGVCLSSSCSIASTAECKVAVSVQSGFWLLGCVSAMFFTGVIWKGQLYDAQRHVKQKKVKMRDVRMNLNNDATRLVKEIDDYIIAFYKASPDNDQEDSNAIVDLKDISPGSKIKDYYNNNLKNKLNYKKSKGLQIKKTGFNTAKTISNISPVISPDITPINTPVITPTHTPGNSPVNMVDSFLNNKDLVSPKAIYGNDKFEENNEVESVSDISSEEEKPEFNESFLKCQKKASKNFFKPDLEVDCESGSDSESDSESDQDSELLAEPHAEVLLNVIPLRDALNQELTDLTVACETMLDLVDTYHTAKLKQNVLNPVCATRDVICGSSKCCCKSSVKPSADMMF